MPDRDTPRIRADLPTDSPEEPIGEARLYDAGGVLIHAFELSASRLYCCTELRFDYSNAILGYGLVSQAEIEFAYDYTPFQPGTQNPGNMKFMGIDDVSYYVPLPAALPLFASALGLAGLWSSRRRQVS